MSHLLPFSVSLFPKTTNSHLCVCTHTGTHTRNIIHFPEEVKERGENEREYNNESHEIRLLTRWQQTVALPPNMACCLFLKIKFYWHIATSIHLCITYGYFCATWQSWVVTTDIVWPVSLKYLLSGPLQNKFADLWDTILILFRVYNLVKRSNKYTLMRIKNDNKVGPKFGR